MWFKKVFALALLTLWVGSLWGALAVNITSVVGSDVPEGTQVTSESASEAVDKTSEKIGALTDVFQDVVTPEGLKEAGKILAPAQRLIATGISLALGILFIALFVLTVLDLAAICVPPLRNALLGAEADVMQAQGGQQGGMGMGMPGMGMPGMGMQGMGMQGMQGGGRYGGRYGGGMGMQGGGMGMGMQQPQQQGGFVGMCIRWVSDEAMSSIREYQMAQQTGEPMTFKSVLANYAIKRIIFYVIFGVVAVLLTSSLLILKGTEAGYFILGLLG